MTNTLPSTTPNPNQSPFVTTPVDVIVPDDGVVLAEQLRAKPEGIPDEAWLAMQSLTGRSKPPVEPSILDLFLERKRKQYGGK